MQSSINLESNNATGQAATGAVAKCAPTWPTQLFCLCLPSCTAMYATLPQMRKQPSSGPHRHAGTRPYHAEPLLLSDQQQCQAAAGVATNTTPSDMFQSALHALDLFDQTSMEQQERLQQELNEESFEQGQAATQVGRSVYEVGQGLHCSRWLCAQEDRYCHMRRA